MHFRLLSVSFFCALSLPIISVVAQPASIFNRQLDLDNQARDPHANDVNFKRGNRYEGVTRRDNDRFENVERRDYPRFGAVTVVLPSDRDKFENKRRGDRYNAIDRREDDILVNKRDDRSGGVERREGDLAVNRRDDRVDVSTVGKTISQ